MVALFGILTSLFAEPISGHVESWDGSPVDDAIVYLFDARSSYEYTRTDSEGFFSFSDTAGNYRILIIPTAFDNLVPAFYPQNQEYCSGQPISSGSSIHMTLEEGYHIQGALETTAGEPIVDAIITAENDAVIAPRGARTDNNGEFVIQGLSKAIVDGWTCGIEAEGFPDQYIGATYEKNQAELIQPDDIGLQQILPGITVGGIIDSPNGPIADAEVYAYSASQVVSGKSDENGSFSLRGLPPGDVLIWSSAQGYATTYAPDHDRPTEFVSVLEEEAEQLDFLVQLPEEKNIYVALVDDGPVLGASVLLYNDNSTVGRGAPVDDQGVATIDRLHPGNYTLQIYAENDGYFNEKYQDENGEPIVIALSEDLELEIPLIPALNLSGTILDDLGQPVYGADIILSNDVDVQRARTDRDGFYQVWGLYEDDWTMSVTYSPLCEADRSYVPMFFPNDILHQQDLVMTEDTQEHSMTLPIDDDHDGMADAWEEEHGLDTTRDDSADDLDSDGVSNLSEYQNQTDPAEEDNTSCGCSGSSAFILFPIIWLAHRRQR